MSQAVPKTKTSFLGWPASSFPSLLPYLFSLLPFLRAYARWLRSCVLTLLRRTGDSGRGTQGQAETAVDRAERRVVRVAARRPARPRDDSPTAAPGHAERALFGPVWICHSGFTKGNSPSMSPLIQIPMQIECSPNRRAQFTRRVGCRRSPSPWSRTTRHLNRLTLTPKLRLLFAGQQRRCHPATHRSG
jgi:hypothetical protein